MTNEYIIKTTDGEFMYYGSETWALQQHKNLYFNQLVASKHDTKVAGYWDEGTEPLSIHALLSKSDML